MPELNEIESKTFSARDFRLESGKTLPVLELAYETYGTLSPARDNAILVVHGYTSSITLQARMLRASKAAASWRGRQAGSTG